MSKKIFYEDPIIRKPSENLAINNYYSKQVSDKIYDVIARVYRHSNGIILGRNHDISDVNLAECEKEGYEVARRITGGLAVIVDPSVICYSVIVSKDIAKSGDIKDVYKKVVMPLAEKLGPNFTVRGNYYIRQKVCDD
ncbi:MAG: lipoate--protein ligase family protein, partial [Nanoarchaeota archaeon]